MITVEEAEELIQSQVKDYGVEGVPFELALGRVLAEDLLADRDLPPFNRVAMDGIAIRFSAFQKGIRSFTVKAVQAAGETPVNIADENECVEIMTGAALPETADTVIRYEDIDVKDHVATVLLPRHSEGATATEESPEISTDFVENLGDSSTPFVPHSAQNDASYIHTATPAATPKTASVKKQQNVHQKGTDKKQGDLVAAASQVITASLISLAASIGRSTLSVKKLPRVVIISTGDELVDVDETPSPQQIRRSNNYIIKAVLQKYAVQADMIHLPDELEITRQEISRCLQQYDVILLSGGVSMGKFDYVPQVLQELSVEKYFHKVQQRPGKPFWFGAHPGGALVFAFPGNPVSAFMCLHRYCVPWLKASLGISCPTVHAILNGERTFDRPLQYFMQVKIEIDDRGQLLATPEEGNGSGDFTSLLHADAFMELPAGQSTFKKGEVYKLWVYNFS